MLPCCTHIVHTPCPRRSPATNWPSHNVAHAGQQQPVLVLYGGVPVLQQLLLL